ncbi:unnamed protein product [Trichobilharzia regenti]|nr:unnamed protein product [Trichobilharzia regenti]
MSELDCPRSHHALICIENYLYIFGGYCLNWATNYSPASDSILVYDICTNQWSNSHHKLPFSLVDTCALLLMHKGLSQFLVQLSRSVTNEISVMVVGHVNPPPL